MAYKGMRVGLPLMALAAAVVCLSLASVLSQPASSAGAPPQVQMSWPAENFCAWGLPSIVVTAQAPAGLKTGAVYVDGEQKFTVDLGGDEDDFFIYKWPTKEFADGPHTVMAKVWDTAGNESEVSASGRIDNASLKGNLILETSGALRRGRMVTFRATQSDPSCGIDKTYVFIRPARSTQWYPKGICTANQCDIAWNTRGSRRGVYVARAVAWNKSNPEEKYVTDLPLRLK